MRDVRTLLIGSAVACWVVAAVFTVIMMRAQIQPRFRRAFRRLAWAYGIAITAVFALTLIRGALPEWVFAWMLGVTLPWLIAFGAAGIERGA